jgi:hypothetical protein
MVKQSGIYQELKDSIPKPGAEGSNPFSRSSNLGTFKRLKVLFCVL